MANEAHVRIDDGVLRGKRQKVKPSDLERQARDEAGQFLARYTPELKEQAISAALVAVEAGGRVDEVAEQYQIPRSTLYSWLIGDERCAKLRTQFFDGQAARNLSEIRASATPLDLARAREELAGWIKVAERRDAKSWAQKQEVTGKDGGPLQVQIVRFGQDIEGSATVVSDTQCTATLPVLPLVTKPE